MPLTPFAERVLMDHRRAPAKAFYDLDLLGSTFSSTMLTRLDEAYDELVQAGLVERSGDFVRFFDDFKPLYRLTAHGRAEAEVA